MGWNYIIAVRYTTNKELKSIISLDSFIKYEDENQEKFEYYNSLVNNKLLKTDPSQAISMSGLNIVPTVAHQIRGLSLRANANNLTVHKFHMEDNIDEEIFSEYVDTANIVEDTRKKLAEARIRL